MLLCRGILVELQCLLLLRVLSRSLQILWPIGVGTQLGLGTESSGGLVMVSNLLHQDHAREFWPVVAICIRNYPHMAPGAVGQWWSGR